MTTNNVTPNNQSDESVVFDLRKLISELNEACKLSFSSEPNLSEVTAKIDNLLTQLRLFGDVSWIDVSIKQSIFFNFMQTQKEHSSRELSNYGTTVYLIKGRSSGLYKIGVSTNLNKRLKQISNTASEEIDLIFQSKGGRAFENALHNKFKSKNMKGEWFSFSERDVRDVIAIMEEQK